MGVDGERGGACWRIEQYNEGQTRTLAEVYDGALRTGLVEGAALREQADEDFEWPPSAFPKPPPPERRNRPL